MQLQLALREAASVLWPRACFGCGEPDDTLCEACRRATSHRDERTLDGVPFMTIDAYEGALRKLVLASKEDGSAVVTRALAASLASLITCSPAHDTIVIAPSSAEGWVRRGFDPMRMLLRNAGLRFVQLHGESGVQKRKSAGERANRAPLRVGPHDESKVRERRCLVVDDVVTTGATMRAIARAVRGCGGTVVGCASLAWVPRSR